MQRDFLLSIAKELGFHDTIRDQEQARNGEQASRHAFNDEKKSPRRHGALDLRNPVREGAAVGVCHCGAADEDAVAETDFFACVEEAEVEGDAGAEHGCCFTEESQRVGLLFLFGALLPCCGQGFDFRLTFCHSEEEAASHQTTPVESRCLDRGDEAPEEDAECTPQVWRELLPAHARPSKKNGNRQQESMPPSRRRQGKRRKEK
jgi:hypothetical protein